ncbi:MAG: hypothetical protein IJK73_02990 [Bacteroidales bacterium]|nr:hypothetical protein [Bacteroidales bacterium]
MNIRLFIIAGMAALVASACTKEAGVIQTAEGPKTIFYADLGEAETQTRTYIDENLKIHWNQGDLVSIFQTTSNDRFRFKGDDGARSGEFEENCDAVASGDEIGSIYAVYPYSEETSLGEGEILSVNLPGAQAYAEKSFGPGANTMVCKTDSDKLLFKNVGGYLVIKMYGDAVDVKSVSLSGNNGETVAGQASINFSEDGIPSAQFNGESGTTIGIDCETAVSLGTSATDYTEFWFVVPPVTFSNGFTLKVTGVNGATCEKSTSKPFNITRNEITSMKPFKVELSGGNQIGPGEEEDGGDY